ncbi:DUF6913 domain-containing protein [Salinimicrobium soli]|uniref:DUF6913 domain-containing protein n=1 Tax=Salinimicrobium soli TaxID=1254399 RepID=UPI003AAF4C74
MKLLDLKIAAAQRKRIPGVVNPDLSTGKGTRKLGIILDSEDSELRDCFLNLKAEMGIGDLDFHIVTCKDKTAKNDIFHGPVFTKKDISWSGKIKNGEVDLFLENQYHLVICFAEDDNKLALLLVSLCAAALKVGRASMEEGVEDSVFDLSISASSAEPQIFIEELKKYLKIIKKQVG